MGTSIVNQVIEQLSAMPEHLQRRVLDYTQSLTTSIQQGIPGRELLKFAGKIPPDDLAIMEAAIEAGCEQVDVNEW